MAQRDWTQYLIRQTKLHPAMEPQDVFKMMFQAAFGAEHILQDKEAAYSYLQKEYEEVMPEDRLPEDELLYEQIGEDVYRVNLRVWKKRDLPLEWLFRMFAGSVGSRDRVEQGEQDTVDRQLASQKWAHDLFLQYEKEAEELVKAGCFSFSYDDFRKYKEEYNQTVPHAVHHSERYRDAEKPAYRLVSGKYIRVLPILCRLADATPIIITIDGRCASGKSTMAQILAEVTGAGIVHMDDFFLPPGLRTEERLAQPGGNVHYERFREEILPFLQEKSAWSYRRFDCSRMELGELRMVAESPVRVVEGAYSNHPIFGEYADVKVFSDVAPEKQLERIASRDGEDILPMFKERWIPMEESYFSAYGIREKATIIV